MSGPITRRIRKSGIPPRRILLADDSRPFRTTLRLLLQAMEPTLDVLEADDGIAALKAIEEHGGVDILICDLEMPKLDGRKLIQTLAPRADRPEVVVMSGTAPQRDAPWASGSVIGWLEKPFDPEALIELLYGPQATAQTAS